MITKLNILFKRLITLSFYFLLFSQGYSQTLTINEFSNGPSGTKEYIEFVVVNSGTSYDCVSLSIPCVDIRGWIIDDNNGYHGSSGILIDKPDN